MSRVSGFTALGSKEVSTNKLSCLSYGKDRKASPSIFVRLKPGFTLHGFRVWGLRLRTDGLGFHVGT